MPRFSRAQWRMWVLQHVIVLGALLAAIVIFTQPSNAEDPPPCVTFDQALQYLSENQKITGYFVSKNGVIFARVRNGPIVFSVPQEGTGCMTRPVPIIVPPSFIDAHPELKQGEGT